MHRPPFLSILFAISAYVAASSLAPAQCVFEEFEGFTTGTAVTTQVEGVTFSVVGQSCSGSPTLHMRVASSFYGDTFSSNVLLIDTGCPDFSSDYLRMVFEFGQGDVRFSLGPGAGSYTVRAYTAVSGGSPVVTQSISIPGSGFVGAHYPVHVARAARDIRRIEVQSSAGLFEAIDDLRFGEDDTPPTIQINAPLPRECIAGEFRLTGTVCDDDGAYDRDRMEYMRTWPDPQTGWTLVREYVGTPVCTVSSLYAWDTTAPGIADGVYVLRVTSINACGGTTTEDLVVNVDNAFDAVDLRMPLNGHIVGGAICFEGTAADLACFDHYVVDYKPAGGGTWLPVNPAIPTYTNPLANEPLASWPDSQVLPDGEYTILVEGTSSSGATASRQIALSLDNTPPTATIDSPNTCHCVEGLVEISGTAYDANIDEWSLHYLDPSSRSWVYIEDDSDNSVNALLAKWDTSGLPPCVYLLRLRVTDRAVVDICTNPHPHVTDFFLPVAVGLGTDTDFDGDTDLLDYLAFQLAFTGPLP